MMIEGSIEPKPSVVEVDLSIVLTVSLLYTCPLLAPHTLTGFRYIVRRYCGTLISSQHAGNPSNALDQYSRSTGSTCWTRAQSY